MTSWATPGGIAANHCVFLSLWVPSQTCRLWASLGAYWGEGLTSALLGNGLQASFPLSLLIRKIPNLVPSNARYKSSTTPMSTLLQDDVQNGRLISDQHVTLLSICTYAPTSRLSNSSGESGSIAMGELLYARVVLLPDTATPEGK